MRTNGTAILDRLNAWNHKQIRWIPHGFHSKCHICRFVTYMSSRVAKGPRCIRRILMVRRWFLPEHTIGKVKLWRNYVAVKRSCTTITVHQLCGYKSSTCSFAKLLYNEKKTWRNIIALLVSCGIEFMMMARGWPKVRLRWLSLGSNRETHSIQE
jgi:hypothetical protein